MNEHCATSKEQYTGKEHVEPVSAHKTAWSGNKRHDHAEHKIQKTLATHDELMANKAPVDGDYSRAFFHGATE